MHTKRATNQSEKLHVSQTLALPHIQLIGYICFIIWGEGEEAIIGFAFDEEETVWKTRNSLICLDNGRNSLIYSVKVHKYGINGGKNILSNYSRVLEGLRSEERRV